MADLSTQRETMWLNAMRQVGHHFAKIGDIILKCAEDTERLAGPAHPSYERGTGEEPTSKRRKRVDEPLRAAASSLYRPVTGGPLSHQRAKYTSPKDSSRFARPAPRDAASQLGQAAGPDDDDEDLTLSQRFYARRRNALSASDRQSSEDRYRRDSGQLSSARGRASRTSKRVRVNWTDAENNIFFDTIRRYCTEDDNSVLHKIVASLGGSRTLLQCKGHFRNLLFVGKVIQSDTEPRRWIVVEEPLEKRTSLGGKSMQTDSKNSRSSAASREDSPSRGKERDDPEDPRLGDSQHEERGQSSHQEEKPVDDEHDVVLDDIEDDDDRDKDYQDEDVDEDNEVGEENDSGNNTTAIRVTDVGEIDPGVVKTEFESRGLGSSTKSIEEDDSKTSGMPLKKQPGGRVGEIARAQALEDKDLG